MISPKLKDAFNELDINDKRDAISNELIIIAEMIKKIKSYYGMENGFEIKNYDIDTEMSESDMLTFIYEDVFELERQIMLILSRIGGNE
jgi:hypothetical protein